MKNTVMAIFVLAGLALSGCAVKDNNPISRTEFILQPSGKVCAEVWVTAPSPEGCKIEGDTAQDVVSLIHPKGRMALPERIDYDGGLTGLAKDSVDRSGYVPISVYHLIRKADDLEIGYYKRKFARQGNQ